MDLRFPQDERLLTRQRASLLEQLRGQSLRRQPVRLACLGGSSTQELLQVLELFLLSRGLDPAFYVSDFNRFVEEALFPTEALRAHRPELVFLHNGLHNLDPALEPAEAAERLLELADSLQASLGCRVILNNLPFPGVRPLGNLDSVDPSGLCYRVLEINRMLHEASRGRPFLRLLDVHYLAAHIGLENFHSPVRWHTARMAESPRGTLALAASLGNLIGSLWGLSKKCLVVDLDNTLWGGVIGEDGVDGIELGPDTPTGEAHQDLQAYIAALKARGVVLAIASKNEEATGLAGLGHPASRLRPADFGARQIHWEPKDVGIRRLSETLNLPLSSFVFLDDNPAEREIVRANLPEVAVPEVEDVLEFRAALDSAGYFEPGSLTAEDRQRALQYGAEEARQQARAQFSSYREYLQSLAMVATVELARPGDLARVEQLLNKTNQFNLTGRRVGAPELERHLAAGQPLWIARLRDRFGDHGLVSVVVGEVHGAELHLRNWVMSCRVFKRGLEDALAEHLRAYCESQSLERAVGYFRPTGKNGLVAELYSSFGFTPRAEREGETQFQVERGQWRPASHEIRSESDVRESSDDPTRDLESARA